MTLRITADLLRATYDMLNCCAPFDKFNLPDGEDVTFRVIKDKTLYGWYQQDGDQHVIAVSSAKCGHLFTVVMTMAHEMVHLIQRESGMDVKRSFHGPAFQKLATKVCDHLGFDPKMF
jgi:hypothetical protein